MSAAEYRQFVSAKLDVAFDWSAPVDPRIVEARRCAHEYTSWLYDRSLDELRPARPFLDAAKAIAPYCIYNTVSAPQGETCIVEYWDSAVGVWRGSGGKMRLKEMLPSLLETHLRAYHFAPARHEIRGKFALLAKGPHYGFKDTAWINQYLESLLFLPTPFRDIQLDSLPSSRFHLVFSNGVTIDFSQPFDRQVRPSVPADRNSWRTQCSFQPHDSPQLLAVGHNLVEILLAMSPTTTDTELIESVGAEWIELMKSGHAPMFQESLF